jgi:hypothetical protein
MNANLVFAAFDQAFPMGSSMKDFGTILAGFGSSGSDDWLPAACVVDTARYGLSAGAIDYFGTADNAPDDDYRYMVVGGYVLHKKVRYKISFYQLNAYNIYREQVGRASIGFRFFPGVIGSIEAVGYRASVCGRIYDSHNALTLGTAALAHLTFLNVYAALRDVPVYNKEVPGLLPLTALRVGVSTLPHRFGAQGVAIDIQPTQEPSVRLFVGQELRIHPQMSLSLGISAIPLMFSMGCTIGLSGAKTTIALVQHPLLGWSKGISAGYVRY